MFDVAAVAAVCVVLARGRPRPRLVVDVSAFLDEEALVVAVVLLEASPLVAAPSSFLLFLLASPDDVDDDPRFLRFIFLRARAATS